MAGAAPVPALLPSAPCRFLTPGVTTPAAAITESRASGLERVEEGRGRRPSTEGRARGQLRAEQPPVPSQIPREPAAAWCVWPVCGRRRGCERGAAAGSGGWHHGREGVHQGAGPRIEQLNECKQLSESQVKSLCEKVSYISDGELRAARAVPRKRPPWGGCNMEAEAPVPRASWTRARHGPEAAPGRPGAPAPAQGLPLLPRPPKWRRSLNSGL